LIRKYFLGLEKHVVKIATELKAKMHASKDRKLTELTYQNQEILPSMTCLKT
jgi:hypothetical protein